MAIAVVAIAACACGGTSSAGSGHHLEVVAAENFWGSIAGQLGGGHVTVTSVVTDPNADPHEYESNTSDARLFATADYVIVNGAGYDDWAQKLLDANPSSSRVLLRASDLLGKHAGDNPHFWYSPDYVRAMVDRIAADYERIDSADSRAFAAAHASLLNGFAPYRQHISSIQQQFHGVKIAATEDIVVYLASALGLDVISPRSFMQAVAEGNEPSAADVIVFQQQLTSKEARVLLYNTQTVTAITTEIRGLAGQSGVEVVGLSETLQPPGASFQDWQVHQLTRLQDALVAAGSASEQ